MTSNFERRPWGCWQVLDSGNGYKVKRIEVDPQQRLSYQIHELRSEHWVVVSGVATCTIDGRTVVARAGETVDVPVGAAHRIANAHDELLVIIEIQRGAYTGEDDIVRLQDDYGRSRPLHC
jgi:mannose-6-phosphate isomerase-like protein (cupin superfamily)